MTRTVFRKRLFSLALFAAVILVATPSATAAVNCVPNLGVDGTCTVAFATIQAAISGATAGEMILVGPGTFADFDINKNVHLKGAKAGIDACGRDGMGETEVTGIGIPLADLKGGSAGTIIDGFTFKGGTNGLQSSSGPIDGVQILNNRFIEFTSSGIFLNDSGNDITIDQNLIDGTSQTGGGGILHLDQDAFDGMWITNNCISNGATGLFSDGNRNVGASAVRQPLLDGNRITGNNTGVNLGRKSWEFCDISDNFILNNAASGLLGGPADCLIDRNFFVGNGGTGLPLTGFGGSGDASRGAQRNLITFNCFSKNGDDGLFFSSGQFAGTISSNTVNNNNIVANLDSSADGSGAVYFGSETIDATSNWWGAADGPSGDGPGSGDSINGTTGGGAISFAPFLVAPLILGQEICDNGFDDDCDGLTDGDDPDCVFDGACCDDGPGTDSECIIATQADCEANGGLYLGDGTICGADLVCEDLLVVYDSITATATARGVLLQWTTAMELDTVGFRILRESVNSREKAILVVAPFIAAAGANVIGASYEFVDPVRMRASSIRYYIEDIDSYGRVTRHGPIAVDAGSREIPTRTLDR